MSDETAVRVLVVDDGRDNREFLAEYILKPHGYEPLMARDGYEALEAVRRDAPDIMLLDLQMPRMNGMEVLDALQDEGIDIPVILMTFHGSEEIAIEVYRKGVRDYVKKPYTVDEMLDALNRALNEVRLRRDKEALTERLLRANAGLTRRVRELNALYQIGKSVTALVDMKRLLPRIVDAAVEVIGAEQGALLLVEGDQLICRAQKAHNEPAARAINEACSDRIALRAANTGQAIVLSPEELAQYRRRNPMLPAAVACIPLRMRDQVVGVLCVENVSAGARSFTQRDGTLLEMLGDYAAIAIENARNYAALEKSTAERTETLRSAFARYVAPSVVQRVLENPDLLQLGGTRREITVVFADARSYTAYTEHAEPEDVVNLLNDYFRIAIEVIFSREGTLDKFLGDAVMAFFNAPEDQHDHPYRAVDAALALQRAVAERNARGDVRGLRFGIGVHVGEAVVGNVGANQAMNYTAIGDTVNIAKRLQEHAAPGDVLISAAVYARLGDRVKVEPVGDLVLKGRSQPVEIYKLIALA